MITAYGGVESYLEAMNLGAFEYINKPVKLDELKSVMKKIFHEAKPMVLLRPIPSPFRREK